MKYTYSLILEYFKTRKINTLLSVLLYIAASVLAMLPAKIIQLVIDEGFLKRSKKSLLIFTGLLLFVYVCKSVFSYISNKKLIELGNGLLVKFKSKIYDRLMSMDLSFYSNYKMSARCPHLGCELTWNPDECSWDCPCHGSRFDVDGNLLDNPSRHRVDNR